MADDVIVTVPLTFYEWLATIERDVLVHDLTPFEQANLCNRLASTAPSDAPADVVVLPCVSPTGKHRTSWDICYRTEKGAIGVGVIASCFGSKEQAEIMAAALSRPTVDASEVERLREDKARVDWLQREFCDVRWISDGEDGVGLRIISHHMAKPQERVEAENWSEDLRRAIDEARAALDPKQ